MAYFRFNSGATSEVDDEELMELIKAGAGTEVDAPNPTPAGVERVTLEHPDTVVMGEDKSLQGRIDRALEAPWRDEMMPEGGYPFAPGSPNILQRGYQLGKDALSVPLAGIESGVVSASNAIPGVSWLVNGITGSAGSPSLKENYQTAWEGRNQGLRSFGNDPINAALLAANFVPGLDVATAPITVGRLGKYGSLATTIGRDVAIGAGTGAAEAYLDPDSHMTPAEGAFSGGSIGGIGAGVGAGLRAWGRGSIPGIGKKFNLKVPEESKELYRQNADAVLSHGFWPKGREGFLRLAEGLQKGAAPQYEEGISALERAKPDLRFDVNDWASRARTHAVNSMGDFDEPGLVLDESTPLGYRLNDIAEGILSEKLNAVRASKLKHTPRAWETPEGAQYWDPEMIKMENARLANELTPREMSFARTGTTDPIVYQNPVAEVSRYRRKGGRALHDAGNDMLLEHPEYAEALGEIAPTDQIFHRGSAPQRFKLGATIEDITNSPGAIGLANRLNLGIFNPSVDPWFWGSAKYKLGQAVDHAGLVPVTTGLWNGYRALTGGIPDREMEAESR